MHLGDTRSGEPSPLFGKRFPYPLSGKYLLHEIASGFANEFNQTAKVELSKYGASALTNWSDLTVTSAYPTTKQGCPRIAIIQQGSSPRFAGLGAEIETYKVEGEPTYRVCKGQQVTDTIEIAVCTLNEQMRDEIFLWFQQYMIDALAWLLPQLHNVWDLRCVNAVDDQVEYQGTATHPGFQFYAARLTYQVGYDLIVFENVDILKTIINWQQIAFANQQEIGSAVFVANE